MREYDDIISELLCIFRPLSLSYPETDIIARRFSLVKATKRLQLSWQDYTQGASRPGKPLFYFTRLNCQFRSLLVALRIILSSSADLFLLCLLSYIDTSPPQNKKDGNEKNKRND